ncbi:MAG: ATP-binding protein [Bacteroidales bacterium]
MIINLLKNAIEAFDITPNPCILLTAYRDNDGREVIVIHNNGTGIYSLFHHQEKRFGYRVEPLPQIIRLHKGEITIKSSEGSETTVYLKFYTPNKT